MCIKNSVEVWNRIFKLFVWLSLHFFNLLDLNEVEIFDGAELWLKTHVDFWQKSLFGNNFSIFRIDRLKQATIKSLP